MSRPVRALLAVVLLAGAVVGVQLVEPFRGPPTAPAVDYDEPAGELAHDALSQAVARDHVVERRPVASGVDDGPRQRTAATTRVDADDRQLRSLGRVGDEPYLTFANEHVHWAGRRGALHYQGTLDGWHETASRFQHIELLRTAPNVSRTGNGSAVRIHVNDTDTAFALVTGQRNVSTNERAREERYRANLTIVVDRATGAPSRVVYRFAHSPDGNESERRQSVTVYAYLRWGDVSVDRPPGAGYTLVEFFADLLGYRSD